MIGIGNFRPKPRQCLSQRSVKAMFSDIPLIQMLRQKMAWTSARQNVLAQNVSNAQTPGYEARDLKPYSFRETLSATKSTSSGLATTHTGHIQQSKVSVGASKVDADDQFWETTPDGNSVVLEQQMMKMSQNHMEFQSAINLYKKSVAMMKIALSPGGK